MAVYNVTAGKDRATIELTEETKVVFSFTPNVIAVKASGGSALVSLDQGAQEGDDGASVIADGEATIFEPITDGAIYVSGTATVEVWAGRSGAEIPPNFRKSAKGGGGSGGDGTHYKGTTTTAIENGSTTNPITIDGESYTAVFGDVVVYNYTEFVFDGTTWSEFGRPFDTTPTSGSMNAVTSDGIYKRTPLGRGTGVRSASGGLDATSNGNYSIAYGKGVKADRHCMAAFGQFNAYPMGHLFAIGNGTDNNARSNIIEANSTEFNVNGDIKRNGVNIYPLVYDAETESFVFSGQSS